MYKFHNKLVSLSKLVCLYKLVKVIESREGTTLLKVCKLRISNVL